VLDNKLNNPTTVTYVPHGINTSVFRPLTTEQEIKDLAVVKKQLFPKKDYNFILYYNSRNIRRKQTSTILLAWRVFCDSLTPEEASKCVMLLHTNPVDDNGTDLPACKEAFCPKYDVQFSTDKIMPDRMNQYYNIADVTIHLSDNEGFGIATAESLAAGTPIIVSVTGGLQDQCGFVGADGKPVEFNADWGSNSNGKLKKHGKWVTPVYPGARMVQGSVQTPYILGDYTKYEDAAEAMMYWYSIGRDARKSCGGAGREWLAGEGGLNAENMCKTMIEGIDGMLANWKGRERFNIHRQDEFVGHHMPNGKLGLDFPKIDRKAILNKFDNLK
jgi:hypothetical protein